MNRIMNLLLLEGKSQKNRTVIVWIVWRSQHWIQCQAWYCLCLCCQAFFSQKSPIFTPWLKVGHGVEIAVDMDTGQTEWGTLYQKGTQTRQRRLVVSLWMSLIWGKPGLGIGKLMSWGSEGVAAAGDATHLTWPRSARGCQLLFLIWRWIWF